MMRALAAALVLLGAPAAKAPPAPLPPLPMLPSLARIRFEVGRDHVLVVEEVNLPRGEWRGGDLDFYVAYGAPGVPQAFDAHLVTVADGALEPADADAGERLEVDRAPRRPASAHVLLGRPQMAGAVVHVREAQLRRALAPGGMGALRLRSLLALPPEDARGGREVVARLGMSGGTPLTLGRLQLVAKEGAAPIARVEAHLCGAEADPYPLAIALTPKPAVVVQVHPAPVAPVLAVRHASDDLCVRFFAR
jgi:hypothetical protein